MHVVNLYTSDTMATLYRQVGGSSCGGSILVGLACCKCYTVEENNSDQ